MCDQGQIKDVLVLWCESKGLEAQHLNWTLKAKYKSIILLLSEMVYLHF